MNGLEGRVAIVTGGADGIGEGAVRRLAAEGAKVLLADFDAERGARVADELGDNVIFREVDVMQRDQVEAMVDAAIEAFGTIDILVNNAWGGGGIRRIEFTDDEAMDHALTLGFKACMWAMRRAFPTMKEKQYGRIVNLASLNGVNAHPGSAPYNSSKEALRAYTRTAAREWAPHNITCNILCPAAASAAYKRFHEMAPEMADSVAMANPMQRMGDPEADIAPVIAFLASEESRYMTGNTVHVDGGGHINGVPWLPPMPDE